MGYNDQAPGFRKCSTAENPGDTLRATATATSKAKATMARPTRAKSLLIDYSKTPAPPQELERFNDWLAAMNPSNHEKRRDHEHEHEPSNDPQELQDSSAQHCSEHDEQDNTQHDEYCMTRRFCSRQSLASTTDSCSTATASLLDQLPWQQQQDDDSNHDNNHNLSSASIGLPELAPIVPLAGRKADDSIITTSTVTRMNSNSDSNLEDSTMNAYYDKSCVSLVGSLPQLDLTSQLQCPVSSSTGARFCRRALLAPTRRYQSLSSLSEHHQVPTSNHHDNVLSFSLRRRGSERNTNHTKAIGINRSNTWDYNHTDNNHYINDTMNGAGVSSRERFHNSLTNLNMNISNHDLGFSMADLNTNNTHNTNNNNNNNNNNNTNNNNMDNSSIHHQAQEQTPIQRRRAQLVRHSSVSALNLYQSSITTPSLQPLPQIHARSLSTSLHSQHPHPHTPFMIATHQSSVFSPAARRRSTNHPMSGGSSNNNEKQPLLNLPQTIELITPRSIPTRRSSTRRQPSSANMVMRSSSHHGAASTSSTRRRSSTDTGTSAESNSSGGSSKENRRHYELLMSASSHSYFPTTAAAAVSMTTSRERKQATLLATLASKHSCTNAIKMTAATTSATTTATATTTGSRRDMLTRSLSSRRHLGRTNIMKNTNTKRRGSLHAHLVSTGAIVAGGNGNNKTNNAAMMAGFGGAKSVGAGSWHTADQSSSMMDNDSSQFVTGSRIRRRMSSRDLFL